MAKDKTGQLEKFLSDPSHADERDFLRGVFDAFKAEDTEKAKKTPVVEKTFLERLFDGGE